MLVYIAAVVVVVSPAVLLATLALATLVRVQLSEQVVARMAQTSSACGFAAGLCVLTYMLAANVHDVPMILGDWVTLDDAYTLTSHSEPSSTGTEQKHEDGAGAAVGTLQEPSAEHSATVNTADTVHVAGSEHEHDHFHFLLKFAFDRLSVPFVLMSFLLCGVIGSFAFRYMHLEQGYHRFFLYYAVFQLGMILSSLAGTIETLFLGWELVGLSSALLVAFFHDRLGPVQNGLRVWSVYRIADAAFLVAALTLHHLSGSGDFEALMGQGDWPYGAPAAITEQQALLVGSLLLIAAAGKSALVPFSGWLPRAMEGPTPSSAVFYGALSVHLGAFLLLRVSPVLDRSLLLSGMVVALGLVTMVFAAMAARVQTDIKSALSFASLTQVSIIVIEIGIGLRYIPLIHIIGHACVRTLQLVRAPSLLKDQNALENAIGDHLSAPTALWQKMFSPAIRERIYRFAWERGYLDSFLDDFVVRPFVSFFKSADQIERKVTKFMSGQSSIRDKSN